MPVRHKLSEWSELQLHSDFPQGVTNACSALNWIEQLFRILSTAAFSSLQRLFGVVKFESYTLMSRRLNGFTRHQCLFGLELF